MVQAYIPHPSPVPRLACSWLLDRAVNYSREIGRSETTRMPFSASALTNCSAST